MRTEGVTLTFTSDLQKARSDYEAWKKEVESRPVRVNFDTGGSARATGATAATFSNPGGIASSGNAGAASQRLDATTAFRVSGPSLAMQNGQPGAPSGGLAYAPPNESKQALNQTRRTTTAYATSAQQAANIAGLSPADAAAIFPGVDFSGTPSASVAAKIANAVSPNRQPTALDTLRNRINNAQSAALGALIEKAPDADAYVNQYNKLYNKGVAAGLVQGPLPQTPAQAKAAAAAQQQAMQNAAIVQQARAQALATIPNWNAPPPPQTPPNAPGPAANTGGGTSGGRRWYGSRRTLAAAGVATAYSLLEFANNQAEYGAGMIMARGNLSAQSDVAIQQAQGLLDFSVLGIPVGAGVGLMTGAQNNLAYARTVAANANDQGNLVAATQAARLSQRSMLRRAESSSINSRVGGYAGARSDLVAQIADLNDQKRFINENNNDVISKLMDKRRAVGAAYSIPYSGGDNYGQGSGYDLLRDGKFVGSYGSQADADRAKQSAVGQAQREIDQSIASERQRVAAGYDAQIKARNDQLAMLDRQRAGQIAQSYVGLRAAQYGLNRNYFGEAFENTVGAGAAAAIGAAPEDRSRVYQQANMQLGNAMGYMRRDNNESAFRLERQTQASRESAMGYSYESAVTTANAKRALDLQQLGGTGVAYLDNALGYTRRRNAINAGADEEIRQARIAQQQQFAGFTGSAQSAGYMLNDRPLDAQINDLRTQLKQQTMGMTNPVMLGLLRGQESNSERLLRRQFGNDSKLIGISQRFQNESLDRQLALDPVGAQAADIAGQTEEEGNRFAMAGRPEEAERARALGKKRLDLLARNYSLSFRGEQIDLRAMRIDNPRDSQNPTEVFAQIQKQQDELSNAKFGSDQGISGVDLSKITGGLTIKDVVAALQALAN